MKTFLAILVVLATLRAAEGIKCYDCSYMNLPGMSVSDHDYCTTITTSSDAVKDFPTDSKCMYANLRNSTGSLLMFARGVANATVLQGGASHFSIAATLPDKGCASTTSTDATYSAMGYKLEVCVCSTDSCMTAPSHAASMASGFHQLLALVAAISITLKTLF